MKYTKTHDVLKVLTIHKLLRLLADSRTIRSIAPTVEVSSDKTEEGLPTHVTPSVRVLLSVSVLTAANEHVSAELPHCKWLWSFPSERVYRCSSEFTPTPQQVAQAHSHVLNLEIMQGLKVQIGHLPHFEVGYAVKPLADLI